MSDDESRPDSDAALVAALIERQDALKRFRQLYEHGSLSDEQRRLVDECLNALATAATSAEPDAFSVARRMHIVLEGAGARRCKMLELVQRAAKRREDLKAEAAHNLIAELSWWVDPAFKRLEAGSVLEALLQARWGRFRIAAELSVSVGAFGDAAPVERAEAKFKDALKQARKRSK